MPRQLQVLQASASMAGVCSNGGGGRGRAWQVAKPASCKQKRWSVGRNEGGQLRQGSEEGAGTGLGVRVMQAGLRNMIPLQMLAQSKGKQTWDKGLSIMCGVRCVHLVRAV